VFSGMLGVTFFGLLLTPVFYLLVRRRRAKRLQNTQDGPTSTPTLAHSH
jgi:HAE1 family hydrophobic/amphiphilic exporter-1